MPREERTGLLAPATEPAPAAPDAIIYPKSDGEPMGENTRQVFWIKLLSDNLAYLFRSHPQVLVAANLFWYPVKGESGLRRAPDVLVAFGRPAGHRGSYQQWEEEGIAPQVVIEITSPGNTREELEDRLTFYQRYGVEEYYLYNPDPEREAFEVWVRAGERLQQVAGAAERGWTSPRLGVHFALPAAGGLQVVAPDGRPFEPFTTVAVQRDHLAGERDHLAGERDRLAGERDHLAGERDRLAARLRELGIDPDLV